MGSKNGNPQQILLKRFWPSKKHFDRTKVTNFVLLTLLDIKSSNASTQ